MVTRRKRTAETLTAELDELQALERAARAAADQGDTEAALAARMFAALIAKRRKELTAREE